MAPSVLRDSVTAPIERLDGVLESNSGNWGFGTNY